MERNDRNRYDQWGNSNTNRYDDSRYNREERGLKQQFERDYRSSHHDNGNFYRDAAYERDNSNRRDDSGGRGHESGRNNDSDRFRNYRSRDYDMEQNYYGNTRGDRGTLGDVRQGYGISSFAGTSDRYNTASDRQRERNNQFEQGYGTGRMSGYSGSAFGGSNYSANGDFGGSSGYGSMSGSGGNMDDYVSSSGYGGGGSSVHSDRGVPNYSMRSFGDGYGAGTGSTYGGKNFGGGEGYASGNGGGSFGNNIYGSYSGNNGSYAASGSGTSGSGGSGFSGNTNHGRYAANADRGGYVNRDPNR